MIMIPLRILMCHVRKCIYLYIHIRTRICIYIYSKIGPKCGKWDYGGLKMWEVGLWRSKNVGSRTLGSTKCGKWDYQDGVSAPPPPPETHQSNSTGPRVKLEVAI